LVDVAAIVPVPRPKATNTPFPKATAFELEFVITPVFQFIPSLDTATFVEPFDVITKTPLPKVIFRQSCPVANVLFVQVMPSGDVIILLLPVASTTTNRPFPYAMLCQFKLAERVLCVQVIPSGDVAAVVDPEIMATKVPLP